MAGEGFNVSKEKNFSQWFTDLLKHAELIDQRYNAKGFLVHQPNAAITEKLVYRALEDELEKHGHKPAFFPAVIPEEYLEVEKQHVEKFKLGVFWITHAGNAPLEQKLALRPTSETAMYKMYSMWIRSWRDLPLKIYQSCQVWRCETKATRPLLRDREFYWIEAHDAFATREEAEAQVLEDMQMTENVLHQQLGVPFFFFKRPAWDKFGGADYTFAADGLAPDGFALQLPSTHLIGQRFAKAFGIKFLDSEEKEQYAWQTCYGPAVGRIYCALIFTHGDDRGLVLPYNLAPTQVVIIPVYSQGNEEPVRAKCKTLEATLKKLRVRVAFDDSDKLPGAKYYYWEARGAAIRIEVGGREIAENSLTVVRRDVLKREKIPEAKLADYLGKANELMLSNLKTKADAWFEKHVHSAKSWQELKQKLDSGGFVRVELCSTEADGAECADIIKAETNGGEVHGTMHGANEKPAGTCIACGKPATAVVYVARSY